MGFEGEKPRGRGSGGRDSRRGGTGGAPGPTRVPPAAGESRPRRRAAGPGSGGCQYSPLGPLEGPRRGPSPTGSRGLGWALSEAVGRAHGGAGGKTPAGAARCGPAETRERPGLAPPGTRSAGAPWSRDARRPRAPVGGARAGAGPGVPSGGTFWRGSCANRRGTTSHGRCLVPARFEFVISEDPLLSARKPSAAGERTAQGRRLPRLG